MKPHKKPKHASQPRSTELGWDPDEPGSDSPREAGAGSDEDASGEKMCPYSLLTLRPREYQELRTHSFAQAIAEMARPHIMLSGVSYDGAEISDYAIGGYGGDRPGAALSFCLENTTYTCFENPDDGYRSSLGLVLARAGNRLQNSFEPVGLLPFACACGTSDEESYFMPLAKCLSMGYIPPILAFGSPDSQSLDDCALAIGTSHYDDWYPCCVMRFSAENLTKAKSYELSFIDELRSEVPDAGPAGRTRKFF